MKTRKDTFLKLIAIPFIMIAFTIFLLSNSNVKAANDTTVALKQDGQKVKVSLSPKEGASIASFQIGLKIEASKASDIKNVTFNWANIGNAKLKKESYDKEKGILNLYVVTEEEQNTGKAIDVGTIKIETNKNTKVTVSPIADKTTASSIAHKDTKVDAKASDKITYTATTSSGNQGGNTGDNNQGGSTNKPGDNQGENNNQGNGSQGGNNSGNGNQGDNNSGNNNQGGSSKPGNTSQGGSSSGNGSTGGNGSSNNNGNGNNNGSNSGSDNKNDENKDDKDNEKDDDEEKNDNENNVEDNNEIDNGTSSNQVDNIATGTIPQTGEKDNFIVIWIVMALVVLVGVLLAVGYKSMNKKNSFKL